jgi:hypothetical protein
MLPAIYYTVAPAPLFTLSKLVENKHSEKGIAMEVLIALIWPRSGQSLNYKALPPMLRHPGISNVTASTRRTTSTRNTSAAFA